MATAAPWPAADALFRRDPGWLGTDDAYSVPLGDGRTLWLFGDTFLGRGEDGRAAAGFVANTVGVQTGLDPSTALLARRPVDAAAGAMFPADVDGEWLWPLDGVRLGSALLVFLMRVRSSRPDLPSGADAWAAEGSLGFFDVVGATARFVADADAPLAQWRPTPAALPDAAGAVLGTAVLVDGEHLLAWAQRSGDALLARWPVADAAAGRLIRPQWWCGAQGWTDDVAAAVAAVEDVPTEFTVHRHDDRRLLLIQVGDPIGRGVVELRTASRPEGPWSAPVEVYRPPETGRPDTLCYAGKAHPELVPSDSGDGELVVTYASIRTTRAATLADESVYWPRFARVDVDAALAGAALVEAGQ
jgi:hypothetical protein